jgi:heme/copper-type cytochrome/quinol oxidase subunit 1
MFFGVNLTFFPIHFLGLNGIPRRYMDYPDFLLPWNAFCRIGSLIRIGRIILLGVIMLETFITTRFVISHPRLGGAIEWSIGAPASQHSFNQSPMLFI